MSEGVLLTCKGKGKERKEKKRNQSSLESLSEADEVEEGSGSTSGAQRSMCGRCGDAIEVGFRRVADDVTAGRDASLRRRKKTLLALVAGIRGADGGVMYVISRTHTALTTRHRTP